MNTFPITTKLNLAHTVSTCLTKFRKRKLPQAFLFSLTGFLVSQFFLLNILYSQHPQGGWATLMGSFSTLSLLLVVLLAIIICLFTLWKSATVITTLASKKAVVKPILGLQLL